MKGVAIAWKKGATEFVIVVVGVMLALAADRWQQEFQEQETAAEYIERLAADLETDIADYQSIVTASTDIDEAAQYVVDSVSGPRCCRRGARAIRNGRARSKFRTESPRNECDLFRSRQYRQTRAIAG